MANKFLKNGAGKRVKYATIREAMGGQPHKMSQYAAKGKLVEAAVNQGIDAYLEACYCPSDGDVYTWNGSNLVCTVSPKSMPTLLRRLFQTKDAVAVKMAGDILALLGIGDDGKFDPSTVLDTFTRAYAEAALWSSTGDDEHPLDDEHGVRDIHQDTLAKMAADCVKFQAENAALLVESNCLNTACPMLDRAGHDFWLTRHHHGVGFWDGDWEASAGEKLTAAAQKYPEIFLYVGDDGKIHGE